MSLEMYARAHPVVEPIVEELARNISECLENDVDLNPADMDSIVEVVKGAIQRLPDDEIREILEEQGFIPSYESWLEEYEPEDDEEDDDED